MNPPKTTLEQWRVLQAIVEYGGYAQAAAALHRSQSSVSYMVARLQEQLGVELLELEGRKAKLTESGQVLLARAGELLASAQSLERLAASLEQGWEPRLRVVVDAAFPTGVLLQALDRYSHLAQQTQVELDEVVLSGAEEALFEGADLVIGNRAPPGVLANHLLDVEFVAVAHRDHPLQRMGRELVADDLRTRLQIVLRDSGQRRPRDEGWLGSRQRWTVTSMHASLAMVANGMGYAWLPRDLVRDALAAGQLLMLPLREGRIRLVSLYLMHGVQAPGPAARALAEVLRHAATQYAMVFSPEAS